jgi:hypothetical protein
MRKSIFIGIILAGASFTFTSCKEKQKKVLVDYDALRPKPARDYGIDPDTVTIPALNPKDVSISFRPIFEQIFEKDLFVPSDLEIYPYRFGASEYLAVLQKDINDNPIGTWFFLLYKDSVMTDNAYLNWMDCFGKECQNLGLGSGDNIAENTGQIWSNDTLIVAFIANQGGTFYPKENSKIDKVFKNNLRFGLKWARGQAGSWSGKMIRK